MELYLRFDEEYKSDRQKEIRSRTYEAAKVLKKNGFDCKVVELWTGEDTSLSPACIHLKS